MSLGSSQAARFRLVTPWDAMSATSGTRVWTKVVVFGLGCTVAARGWYRVAGTGESMVESKSELMCACGEERFGRGWWEFYELERQKVNVCERSFWPRRQPHSSARCRCSGDRQSRSLTARSQAFTSCSATPFVGFFYARTFD